MQKKTLLTLICAVCDIILFFVASFGYCLAIMCCFVQQIVKLLYLACSKKHVQQKNVSQLQDYVTILASVAYARAVRNVKSERAEKRAEKRAGNDAVKRTY